VDDEADSLAGLVRELESRYGSQYRIVASRSAKEAFVRLGELRAEGAAVPLVLADQWMPESTGVELLARVRELDPTARRGLLISWGDRSSAAPILQAAELGQIEFFLPKPASLLTRSHLPFGFHPSVSILVRSSSLAASMSTYLIRDIDNAPNVDVRYGVGVVACGGQGRLEQLELRDVATGAVRRPARPLRVRASIQPQRRQPGG
jgi:CheY-like chemotaxis protein